MPIQPNRDEECAWIRMEGKSRFEPKPPNIHGKLIVSYETPSAPALHGEIRSHPPDATGYSDTMVLDPDGNPVIYRIKDGKVYHSQTMEYIGEKKDFIPPAATDEQMDEAITEARASLQGVFNLQPIKEKTNE